VSAAFEVARQSVLVKTARINTEKKRFIYLLLAQLLLVYIYIIRKVPALNCRRIEVSRCHIARPIRIRGRVPRKVRTTRNLGMWDCKNSLGTAIKTRY
jgi:hypothetical protein